jgi:hypothetical protein
VFVFGDKDDFLSTFVDRVNIDDRLGLATKESERVLLLIEGSDHTFSVLKHTQILINWTTAWAQALRDGTPPQFDHSKSEITSDIAVAAPAN